MVTLLIYRLMVKQVTLDIRIKRLLKQNMLSPFFIVQGINLAKQVLDGMTDEELSKYFGFLYHPQDIRRFYKAMSEQLNGNDG